MSCRAFEGSASIRRGAGIGLLFALIPHPAQVRHHRGWFYTAPALIAAAVALQLIGAIVAYRRAALRQQLAP